MVDPLLMHVRRARKALGMGSVWAVLAISSSTLAADDLADRVDISGFARVVAGATSGESATFQGYDDEISFSEQSLFALQADVDINDKLSVSAQGLLHSSSVRDSGLEWFYLTYRPTNAWQIKLGRLRTAFANYSDVVDVGFAYPWITAPIGLYGSYLFTNYDGASVRYSTSSGELALQFEAYYGQDETTIDNAGREFDVEIDNARGLIAQGQYQNFKFRVANHQISNASVVIPEIDGFADTLRGLGFNRSANSLNPSGALDALQLGVRYDDLAYFAEAEYLSLNTEAPFVAPIETYYLTVGRSWRALQFHLTYGRSSSDRPQGVNEIPVGLDPGLDALAGGYDLVFSEILLDEIDYQTAGVRWDVQSNLALKAEMTRINERAPSRFFERQAGQPFDGELFLYQVALEWLF